MFDIIVLALILLLGVKGLLNGFFKELFGLIGIIGGIFIASRISLEVGTIIDNALFHFDNEAAINLTGFIVSVIGFWLIMIIIGKVFSKMSKISGLGVMDKVLGFIFSAGKYFLIASVILYAASTFKVVAGKLDVQNSIAMPIMIETGSLIMQIDTKEISEELDNNISEVKEQLKNGASDMATDVIKEVISNEMNDTVKAVEAQLKEHNITIGE